MVGVGVGARARHNISNYINLIIYTYHFYKYYKSILHLLYKPILLILINILQINILINLVINKLD